MKKALKELKHITEADKVLKHAGLALIAGGMAGLLAALLRSAF